MENISRKVFLSQLIKLGAVVGLSANASFGTGTNNDSIFFKKVVLANNEEVAKLLQILSTDITEIKRRLGFDLANLAAAFTEPSSRYYQQKEIISAMHKIATFLVKSQNEDGTLDIGNLASPPDTAFILEPLCSAAIILKKVANPALDSVKNLLKTFVLKAGEGLRLGGIHTPNHRWVVSAALARIYELFPDKKYATRIDQWLSEGVFMDKDGHYLERSQIYAEVSDRALITVARIMNKPQLFAFVRKNLNMTYFYLEPNGDLVCNDSRRQDQFISFNILDFYHDYRYMAMLDKNAEFAAITQFIERVKGFDERVLRDLLFFFLEEPIYAQALPTPKEPSQTFEKFFESSNLVRFRKNDTTATIFGGVDFPLIIGSGRSTSPNFFTFRKGDAILKYLRFSTDFFSTGYFRSHGIKKVGNKYVLNQKIEAPYYQPLPEQYKRKDANYKHSISTDGRFWNKMDFEHRPQSNIKAIDTSIEIEEKNGKQELKFSVKGTAGVHVTIEFCFNEGGVLTGTKSIEGSTENFTVENGYGTYQAGKDSISFGPGIFQHAKLKSLDGEMYTSHYGTLRTSGQHVYFTGLTPFEHTITIG